ncbi:MAG: DUF4254 domain-containing protein [Bacteroidales bacterium]|jgi:hypothetical protein|nr:DUF4254 domain-containing protein [Bacteroidales bacterium]
MNAKEIYSLFEKQVADYHTTDSVDAPLANPYDSTSFEALLWEKSWVDTVQWHLEDLVRPDDVDPLYALQLKRRIDRSNQHRTDLVEQIDDHFMALFASVATLPDARLNTETPAWAIDRLSILALKIYHFTIEANRGDDAHRTKCQAKLDTLLTQRADLSLAIDQLLDDLAAGRRQMKLYRQMKMYNDPSLNPSLYKK